MIGKSITRNSVILGAFAVATAGLIALTFQGTAARIDSAEKQAAQRALFELVPQSRHDNDLLDDTVPLERFAGDAGGLGNSGAIHIARQNGQPVAYIIPAVAPDGYSGDIRMIVGVNADGALAGVRVLSHKETPGLGDKIELAKSNWILSFDGKSLQNPAESGWQVKKDGGEFDQFTGATITPRAVVRQVKEVLQFVEKYRAQLEAAAESAQLTSQVNEE